MPKFKISIKKLSRYHKSADSGRSFVVVGSMDTVAAAIHRVKAMFKGKARL